MRRHVRDERLEPRAPRIIGPPPSDIHEFFESSARRGVIAMGRVEFFIDGYRSFAGCRHWRDHGVPSATAHSGVTGHDRLELRG
jgi:hypothetical protein